VDATSKSRQKPDRHEANSRGLRHGPKVSDKTRTVVIRRSTATLFAIVFGRVDGKMGNGWLGSIMLAHMID